MLYFFFEKFKLYMFRMLLAPIIRSTSAVYSHRFLSVEILKLLSTDKNLWLYTAVVLLMMGAKSIRNM
jgi:hypothetical protein